jgi:UDP-N-acetylglucosamine 2-epimerase (non-hydrolysing)
MEVKKLKITTVLGTRPEIIRLSRVITEFDKYFEHRLVNTGQNYTSSLNEVFFAQLSLRKPDLQLNLSSESLGIFLSSLFVAVEREFTVNRPDALVVLGDTNSAFAAVIAKRMGITVYHLEAGNRSFDSNIPEEINRKIIDHASDFNLVYSEHARRNLISEGIASRTICLIGSPLAEIIEHYSEGIENCEILADLNLLKDQFILVSLHRQENVEKQELLLEIVEALNILSSEYNLPLIVSMHPRTRNRLNEIRIELHSNISLHEPFGFFEYCKLQNSAKLVISDSGSISEEAAIFGFRAITIRDSMERPEALESGVLILSGTTTNGILAAVELELKLKRTTTIPHEYEINDTSQRVVRFISSTIGQSRNWLGKRF